MYMQVAGRTAYAYTGGKPFIAGRPTIAFVHGAVLDHSIWALQSRYLAHHGWSVLALDLPGHGRSDGPLLTDVEAMADWVVQAAGAAQHVATQRASDAAGAGAGGAAAQAPTGAHIDAAADPPLVIVGHSMGSLIALDAAARHPGSVAGICLVSTSFPMRVSDALLEAAREDESQAFDMINYWSHASLNHRPGTPGPGFSLFMQNRRLMERSAVGTTSNDFRACNDYAGGFERAAAVRCPVLVLQGTRDQMVPPRSARELLSRLPQAKVVEVPGVGHAVMTEGPEQVLGALRDWLGGLGAMGSPGSPGAVQTA
jgi:pimeloyl-ACP methyl ester carboxylesterase